MSNSGVRTGKRISLKTKQCPLCGFEANLKGFASHERACQKRLQNEGASQAFAQRLLTQKGPNNSL